MSTELIKDSEFKQWLVELKLRIRQSQLKAAIKVNFELLRLYWDLGKDIANRQMDSIWGSGFYNNLSKELKAEFPDMKGFSVTNLKYCKYFYQFYSQDDEIRQQLADEINTNSDKTTQMTIKKDDIIRQQPVGEFIDNPLFSNEDGYEDYIINTVII